MSLVEGIRTLLSRLHKDAHSSSDQLPQLVAMVDGAHAVATVESTTADSAAFAADDVVGGIYEQLVGAEGVNLFGSPARSVIGERPVAAAVAEALMGMRSAAFVDADGLVTEMGVVRRAVAWHAPLVIHTVLREHGAGAMLGTSHAGLHAAADAGAAVFIAADAQEAVDLSILARRVAEQLLVPVIVAMDADTVTTFGHVELPTREFALRFLGRSDQVIDVSVAAQELVLGARRRRVPRRVDIDRAAIVGAPLDQTVAPLSAAARREFDAADMSDVLESAVRAMAAATGRNVDPLWSYRVEGADTVILAQGSALCAAVQAADVLNTTHKQHVGVVGLRCVRPLPSERLAEVLRGKELVLVLEWADAPLSGEPPLVRELRSVIQRSAPAPRGRVASPRLVPLLAPVGGGSIHLGDLVTAVEQRPSQLTYLGMPARSERTTLPKRQAMLDRLDDAYDRETPHAHGAPIASWPADGFAWAIARSSTEETLAVNVAQVLGVADSSSMMRRAIGWEPHGVTRIDVGCVGVEQRPRAPWEDAVPRVVMITREAAHEPVPPWFAAARSTLLECASPDDAVWPASHGSTPSPDHKVFLLSGADVAAPTRRYRAIGALLRVMHEEACLSREERQLARAFEATVGHVLPTDRQAEALAAFESGWQDVVEIAPPSVPVASAPRTPPSIVRKIGQAEAAIEPEASLVRFHGATTALYRDRLESQLCIDPFVGSGLMPPMTAAFAPTVRAGQLPTLDAATCTGCGACWPSCPDAAISVAAITPRALIEAGMARGKASGGATDTLKPLVAKLATRAVKACMTEGSVGTALELFADAREVVDAAGGDAPLGFEAMVDSLRSLDLVRNDALFREPEAKAKGSGTLLTLAIDPDRCKSCGVCVEVCEPNALEMTPPREAVTARARSATELLEALPDTAGATIAQAEQGGDMSRLAAITLSRHSAATLVGPDFCEPGSGAKIAMHAMLSVGEYERQRIHQQLLGELSKLRDQLATRARDVLSSALPADDIAVLSDGLEHMDQSTVSLADLTKRLESVVEDHRIDVAALKRITEAGRSLADLHWRVGQGSNGFGRARLSLVLAANGPLAGLVRYPFNPLIHPAIVDDASTAASFARGMISAQQQRAVELFAALRLARLELSSPTEAALAEASLRALTAVELTEDERRAVPPVVVVGGDELLQGTELLSLLDHDWPIKVLVLSSADFAADAGPPVSELALLGYGRHGLVAQSSIAHPDHLFATWSRAFVTPGPALVRVYAPSPARDGFARAHAIEQARCAVESRITPLFVLDPDKDGVFGSRLNVADNPSAAMTWHELHNPAAFAKDQARYSDAFAPQAGGAGSPLNLADYLLLSPAEQSKHVPVLSSADGERWSVGRRLVRMARERAESWRTLQELAGIVTPFTGVVREQADAAVAEAHEARLASLRAEYEQRIAELSAHHSEELARRLRDSLITLATRGTSRTGKPPESAV